MRLMGIDFGTKKVGIAISDGEGTMAFPKSVVPNDGALLEALADMVQSEGVGVIVMGESFNLEGNPNPVMSDVSKMAALLTSKLGVPVVFEPEVFTTKQAERIQGSTELTDASAAALILQSYIDRHLGHGNR